MGSLDQIKLKLTLCSPAGQPGGWGHEDTKISEGIKYAKLPVRGEVSLYLSVSFKCILTPRIWGRAESRGLGDILIVTPTDGARGGCGASDRNVGPSFVIRLR